MGIRSTKPFSPSYEEAVKKLTPEELERIVACFKRYSQSQDYITFRVFVREVLSDESRVPEEFAKALYDAFGATGKGLSLKKLICGLVAIAKGDLEERIKFLFHIFSADGDYVYSYDIFQSMRLFEHSKIPQCVHQLFREQGPNCDKVNYQTFFKWAVINRKSLTITEWLLDSPLKLTCATHYPTFYQTLAGVTHLDENEIVDIEKQYSRLIDYRVGKVTLDQFRSFVCPPIPEALVEGLFIAFDENGDRQVDFKEMVCGISACCRGPKVERHKFVFKIFDRNCDGKIDRSDVELMVEQMLLIRYENSPLLMDNDEASSLDSSYIVDEIFKHANVADAEYLTLDDFRMWSVRSKLSDDLLVVLYQLCHVVFGLPPSTKDDEKVIVKLWLDRETRRGYMEGQQWFLIAKQWWQHWEEWMEFQDQPTCSRGSSPTPKLPHKSLDTNNSFSMNELSSNESTTNGAGSSTGSGSGNVYVVQQPCQISASKLETDDKAYLLEISNSKRYVNRHQSNESGWESESNTSQSSLTKKQTTASVNYNQNGAKSSPSKLSTTSSNAGTSSSTRSWSPCPRNLHNAEKVVEYKAPARPGSIDNTTLVAKDKNASSKLVSLTNEGGILKSDLVLAAGRDFQLVPEPLWKALERWYRGGTPALPRRVIRCPESKQLELELFPVVLTISRHQQQTQSTQVGGLGQQAKYASQPSTAAGPSSFGGNFFSGVSSFTINTASAAVSSAMHFVSHTPHRVPMYTVAFSKLSSVGELFNFLCRQLRLNPDTARLWLLLPTDDNNNMLLLEDETLTLAELKVDSGSQVLIEVRNADLTWPEEMSGLAKNRQILDKSSSISSHQMSERGLTGLNNLGNTCFMNSALQCVSNTQPLTQYFTRNVHLYELNRENSLGMKGQMALQYGNLVQELWSGSARVTAPLKLRWTVCKYAQMFNDFNQHDCQELLSFLLDGLHEDLNRVHQKPYAELKDSDGRPDEIVAAEAWDNHIRRNQSVIVDLFHGLLKSTVVCAVCQNASVRFDPFTFLSLPLPLDNFVFVQLVVIKLNGSTPIKYGLRLQSDERVFSMKQKLSDYCGIACHRLLILQLSTNCLIQEILRDSGRIKPYANSTLYAYELPEIEPAATNGGGDKTSGNQTQQFSNDLKPAVHNVCSTVSSSANETLSQNAFENASHRRSISNVSTSSTSSMSTVSASVLPSTGETSFNGFTIGIQRRTDSRDVYFVAHQRYSPVIFGLPMILPADIDSKTWSGKGLYDAVWCRVSRLVSPVPKHMAQINHALDGDENMYSEFPYELKMVMRDGGLRCSRCPWFKFCTGCLIECREDVRIELNSNCFVAVDWDITALHLRHQPWLEMQFEEHSSVKQAYTAQMEPVSLDSCLKSFTQPEELKDRDNYYCSKCKTHCPANKKLDIWRLPPVLIFHFKRFQNVNDRWVKSCKMVTFPQKDFDPSQYLADANKNQQMKTSLSVDNVRTLMVDDDEDVKTPTTTGGDPKIIANGPLPSSANYSSPTVNGKLSDDDESSSMSEAEDNNSDTVNFVNVNGVKKSTTVKMTARKKTSTTANDANDDVSRRKSETITVLNCGDHNHRLKSDFQDDDLKYDLYAIACHAGMLGAGHYVAYAKNVNSKWYLYNDSSCKEIDPKDIDCSLAYILFYERRGLDYGKYIPDLKGKTPQNLDAADREIESEVKRMCSLQ